MMAEVINSSGPDPFCAEIVRQADEPLLGTATQVQVWFLLEYRAPWRAKATKDNDLPPQVQDFLGAQAAAVPQARLLFIKQQQPSHDNLRFFLAQTAEPDPVLYEFTLETYEDLLALDLPAVAAGEEPYAAAKRERPLFLVCTNGTRDKCCAKFGLPFYQALAAYQGDAVWQSSHIGGHRYAPNVLFLPHSVNYGFMVPDEAQAAANAFLDGQLFDLRKYRGRTFHAPYVQAADFYLRQALSYYSLSGLRLRSAEPLAENSWLVQFDLPAAAETHQVWLMSEWAAPEPLVSCSPPAQKAVPRYRLLKHQVRPSAA